MARKISRDQLEADNESLYADNKRLIAENAKLANKASLLDNQLFEARARIGLLESRLGISVDSNGKDRIDLSIELEEENRRLKVRVEKLQEKLDKQNSDRSKHLIRIHELELLVEKLQNGTDAQTDISNKQPSNSKDNTNNEDTILELKANIKELTNIINSISNQNTENNNVDNKLEVKENNSENTEKELPKPKKLRKRPGK